MNTTRYATHPVDFISYDTQRLRDTFLIENLFQDDQVVNTYSHYDRLIVGGVKPISKPVTLDTFLELKSEYYLQRRELGIINVGSTGTVTADGKSYTLKYKEALY